MSKPMEIWVDALDFSEKGGWKEDTQFVHLMGSGYLIAAGEPGVPVEDATVKVTIPEKGRYRIWVRDRNWMRAYSPGAFTLLVNGEGNGKTLGAMPSDRWIWEIAGDYELEAGDCFISLRDLTGYFGRCAAILLTTDLDYVPSPELEKVHNERARIRGLDTEVKFGGDFDVIVVGGGPGGVPAAIACAREGASVLLIQNRPMLGGNASAEVGITFDGAAFAHTFARETGIAEEIRRLRDRDPENYGDWTRAMEALVAAEKNITVVYHSHVISAEMEGNSIKSVVALNIRELTKCRYSARIFMDCTGDAWLGYYAGARFHFGREAGHEYGETIAPDVADTITMSGCIKSGNRPFFFTSEENVEYHAPEWVPKLPEKDEDLARIIDGNGAKMMWWLEAPNEYDDMWDGEETRDALLLVILGYYDFIKNHWSKRELAQKIKLDFVSVFNGRRESRRLIGDYVLTQDDCTSGRDFEDTVAYAGWHLDIHHPKGIYSGKEGTMYCVWHVPKARIPYRCLYSKNIDNLLFAGRNVSATHVAIGTLRVESTIATMGQAAGTAAAMCIKYNETPRGIYQRHMRELQQTLIRNDQFIPGIPNEDNGEPCHGANVTASSVSNSEVFPALKGLEGELIPLDVPRACLSDFFRSDGDVKRLYLKLHSTCAEPCTVTLHARTEGASVHTISPPGEETVAQAVVPPMGESWVEFPIHVKFEPNVLLDRCFVRFWLDPAEGISWRSVEGLTFNSMVGWQKPDGEWVMTGRSGFRFSREKPVEELADCRPENVVNGWSRIIDATRYEWVSDPNEALPQWIEVSFRAPTEINQVSVVFNTDLTNPATCWTVKLPGVPCCVRDYFVEVYDGVDWHLVADETDNFMRKRIHEFEPVVAAKLRVTVRSTWGDPSARIQEIRAMRTIES